MIYTAEINNWRSQKILLKPTATTECAGRWAMIATRRSKAIGRGAASPAASLVGAQGAVPELAFDTNADLLRTPNDVFVGEVGGVGANSKGQIFVYTRTGHPYGTLGDNRTFYRNGSQAVPVRSRRQVRARVGPGRLRLQRARSACASIRRTTSGPSTRAPTRW